MGRLLLILVFCAGVALGQQSTGTLKGQVSDEFGGVIVGATVVAVNASGAEKTVTTNGEGNFVFNGLAPGKYTIRVTAQISRTQMSKQLPDALNSSLSL